MPLHQTQIWSLFKVAIWRISETESELALGLALSPAEAQKLASCKNPVRRCEFWALRRALAYLLGHLPDVEYDENGKPFVAGGPHLAFSHNADFAAVVVSDQLKLGIDIESCRARILRVAPRFLADSERKTVREEERLAHYTAYWSAKEALLKVEGKKHWDFKSEIKVSPFLLKPFVLTTAVIGKERLPYQVFIWFNQGFILSLAYARDEVV